MLRHKSSDEMSFCGGTCTADIVSIGAALPVAAKKYHLFLKPEKQHAMLAVVTTRVVV